MPTYEFRCTNGHTFDEFHKISDAPQTATCPTCGAEGARAISGGAGLVFKGSGFYLTDYGKNAHRGGAPAAGGNGESKGGEGKGESKSGEGGAAGKEAGSKDGGKDAGSKATTGGTSSSSGASTSGTSGGRTSGGGTSGGGTSSGSSAA